MLSHPVVSGKKTFTAFVDRCRFVQDRTLQEVHVGMRSGESLALADLNLVPGTRKAVKVSLVYPADATQAISSVSFPFSSWPCFIAASNNSETPR